MGTGVIGGADGQTVIFMTGSPIGFIALVGGGLLLLALMGGLLFSIVKESLLFMVLTLLFLPAAVLGAVLLIGAVVYAIMKQGDD
ncbi:MAG: hypothetical protein OSJ64_01100 [Firmicutes bacterium]|nr:hypothetical protein [Bacillota bacterium]